MITRMPRIIKGVKDAQTNLVRHCVSGDIFKVVDETNDRYALRRLSDDELLWVFKHNVEPYVPPTSIDLKVRLTVSPGYLEQFKSAIVAYDVSGMANIQRLNNGSWESL